MTDALLLLVATPVLIASLSAFALIVTRPAPRLIRVGRVEPRVRPAGSPLPAPPSDNKTTGEVK